MSKFGPDPAQIASHADHIVARHMFGGMPQWRTRCWCVASMRELKPPAPVLLVQAPLPPPEWMASSPILPGVLSRPRALLLALYRGNAAASTMAGCLSSHPLCYSLLRAFLAQAKCLSATAVSFWPHWAPFPAPTVAGAPPPPGAVHRRRLLPLLGRHRLSPGHPRRPTDARWPPGASPPLHRRRRGLSDQGPRV